MWLNFVFNRQVIKKNTVNNNIIMSPAFEDLYAVVSAFKTMKKQANKQTQKPSSKQTMS